MTVHTDIVVIGGGASGIAAAIAASSEKRKVVLLDKSDSLGGDSINVNVGTICGAFYRSFSGKPAAVGYPFCRSFLSTLKEADVTASAREHSKGLYVIPYERSALLRVYESSLKQAAVEVWTNSVLESVHAEERNIESLSVTSKGKSTTLMTSAVIDCSGHAIVSQLVGIDIHQEVSYQAAAQIFRVAGIHQQNEIILNMAIKKAVVKKSGEMRWPKSYSHLSIVPGSLRNGKVDLKLPLPEPITAEIIGNKHLLENRKRVYELFEVLRSEVESFCYATLDTIFPEPGVRVLQRSKGRYTLTEEDVLNCRKSETSVATGTWPIEEWDIDGKVKMEYFEPDNGYSIPAGCIISNALDNLFFAGKNISATPRAVASARVIGTGLQTGYAAGKLSCAKSRQEQDQIVSSLHHELEKF